MMKRISYSLSLALLALCNWLLLGVCYGSNGKEKRQVYSQSGPSGAFGSQYAKSCYQCTFGPRTKFHKEFGRVYYDEQGHEDPYSRHGSGIHGYEHHVRGGLTQYPGWVPCRGPFSHQDAENFGINTWTCHSNCYIRMDKNGHIYRGCHQGEWGVDPDRLGCHKQGGALWCFCEGDRCNTGPLPGVRYTPNQPSIQYQPQPHHLRQPHQQHRPFQPYQQHQPYQRHQQHLSHQPYRA